MGITLSRSNPNARFLELGGGPNPVTVPECLGGKDVHVDVRSCNNAAGKRTVDIIWNLEKFPWPLSSNEFDGCVSIFSLEHVSYANTLGWLQECFRVLKPDCRLMIAVPNTEEQLKWIQKNPNGWDGKGLFHAASEKLFGTQDGLQEYEQSNHKAYFSPEIAMDLFQRAGFTDITTKPYGERNTDLVVVGKKPITTGATIYEASTKESKTGQVSSSLVSVPTFPSYDGPNKPGLPSSDRANLFDRKYFDNYMGQGFIWDYPTNEIVARKVLERKPGSVLEFGCGRGYVLKRLVDKGIKCAGLDISLHCHLTRVLQEVSHQDVLCSPWYDYYTSNPIEKGQYDLALSLNFLEYIPEEFVSSVISEMTKVSRRGLHAIAFMGENLAPDEMRCTVRPKEWWQDRFPKNHEVVSLADLAGGDLPEDYRRGDGRIKLSVGCAQTMSHNGWQHFDSLDYLQYALQHGYHFKQVDVRQGLPYGTGVVDLIQCHHVLEHFTLQDGISVLREFRRVIRPDGALRIVVPDAQKLTYQYQETKKDYHPLSDYDEVNSGCAQATTAAGKLWALLYQGHQTAYDEETLLLALAESGWVGTRSHFRETKLPQIKQLLSETIEMSYGYPSDGMSLFMDCTPKVG